MKITVTLDDELAARLREEADRYRWSFEQTLIKTLRYGLWAATPPEKHPQSEIKGHAVGCYYGDIDLDKLRDLDDDAAVSYIRKLEGRDPHIDLDDATQLNHLGDELDWVYYLRKVGEGLRRVDPA